MSNIYANDHNGYKAWLAYGHPMWKKPDLKRMFFDSIYADPEQPELEVAAKELKEALTAIFDREPQIAGKPASDSTILLHLIPQGNVQQTGAPGNRTDHTGYVSGTAPAVYISGDEALKLLAAAKASS